MLIGVNSIGITKIIQFSIHTHGMQLLTLVY